MGGGRAAGGRRQRAANEEIDIVGRVETSSAGVDTLHSPSHRFQSEPFSILEYCPFIFLSFSSLSSGFHEPPAPVSIMAGGRWRCQRRRTADPHGLSGQSRLTVNPKWLDG